MYAAAGVSFLADPHDSVVAYGKRGLDRREQENAVAEEVRLGASALIEDFYSRNLWPSAGRSGVHTFARIPPSPACAGHRMPCRLVST